MSNISECKKNIVNETMKEYENKKLKVVGKRIVKDRKQAIAIALNIAEKNCIYTKNDYELLKEKVNNFLFNDERKISETRVPLTNVKETIILFKYYLKKNNKSNSDKIKNGLLLKIINAGKKGITINKNIFSELNKLYK